MLYSEKHGTYFEDEKHLEFFEKTMQKLRNQDCYYRALVYTLGMCDDTRGNFDTLFDMNEECIRRDGFFAGWQTGSSTKVTRLAFNLFQDRPSTAYGEDGAPDDFNECKRYSVSDIFCCSFAPLFIEAIRLRYPEYMGSRR